MRFLIVLATLPVFACRTPQRLAVEYVGPAEYSAAIACAAGRGFVSPGSEACIASAYSFGSFCVAHMSCDTDDDCAVLAGLDPFDVERVAINRRAMDRAKAFRTELLSACGDYDVQARFDQRVTCHKNRCELVVPSSSRVLASGCIAVPGD